MPRVHPQKSNKKPTAGHVPILTQGFGTRGQVDLIDFQSIPDGDFRFLLNYVDYGTKLIYSEPIVAKRAITVAYALFHLFTVIGPCAILQSDNGKEMTDIGNEEINRCIRLDDGFLDNVIKEVKLLSYFTAD